MAELRAVFLGERSHWPNGRRITLVMMEHGQPERDTMLREVCRMSESDFRRRFCRVCSPGKCWSHPRPWQAPVGVRKFVFNVPGAIGYCGPRMWMTPSKSFASTAIFPAMLSTRCRSRNVRRGSMSERIQPTTHGGAASVLSASRKEPGIPDAL